MHPKDAEGIANSVDPDQTARSSLIWVCTVNSDLSVRKFRNIMVYTNQDLYDKSEEFRHPKQNCCNYPKIWTKGNEP